jgi:hypothetical protein
VQVTKVAVVALVGNTYLARVHLSGRDASTKEVDIDARPSDAINLAVRYNAPMYVNKQVGVGGRMGGDLRFFLLIKACTHRDREAQVQYLSSMLHDTIYTCNPLPCLDRWGFACRHAEVQG